MQTTRWDESLSALAQHEKFAEVVSSIVKSAMCFERFQEAPHGNSNYELPERGEKHLQVRVCISNWKFSLS